MILKTRLRKTSRTPTPVTASATSQATLGVTSRVAKGAGASGDRPGNTANFHVPGQQQDQVSNAQEPTANRSIEGLATGPGHQMITRGKVH